MKKTILTLLISTLALTFCKAQQIEITKVFGGYKYAQNGTNLSISELTDAVKSNTTSFQLIKKAKTKGVFSVIVSGIGGGLTGYPVGTAIGGGKPNWNLALAGVGCLAIGIPIALSADKNIKESVEHYNASLHQTTFNTFKPELKIITNAQGVGIALNF